MSPAPGYRTLFALTGRTWVVVAFLARLPLAMSQLGVLLLVAADTGSHGAGGACAGALAVANALAAPLWGGLADRRGQRRVVLLQSVTAAAALLGTVALVRFDVPWGVVAAGSALTGLLTPQVGPLARVRWRPALERAGAPDDAVETALSYEGAADEASFVLGPALVGLGATLLGPSAALVLAAGLLAVFGSWFALHPTAPAAHVPAGAGTAREPLLTPPLRVLCLAQLAIGTVFGSVQSGTSTLATDAGRPGLTGLLHALLGVGSVVAGLALPRLAARRPRPLPDRLRTFALACLVLSLPLPAVGSLGTLAPVLLLLGLSIAPYMITTFTLGERLTPPERTSAALTLLAASTGLGYALGAALAGRLADLGGHPPAFGVTVAAAALMLLVAATGRAVLEGGRTGRAAALE